MQPLKRQSSPSPTHQEFIASARKYLDVSGPLYTAPIAPMVVTPPSARQATDAPSSSQGKGKQKVADQPPASPRNPETKTPDPENQARVVNHTLNPSARPAHNPASSSKGKGKQKATDLQPVSLRTAEKQTPDPENQARAVNDALDRSDPDFSVTSSRKRSAGRIEQESPSKRAKKSSSNQRHRPYKDCGDETKQDRDTFIACIQASWKVPFDQWMPASLMPGSDQRIRLEGGKIRSERKLLEPRDWQTPLLRDLAFFAQMTEGHQSQAFQALRDSVSRKGRGGGGPRLLKTDIHYAAQSWQLEEPEPPVAESSASAAAAQRYTETSEQADWSPSVNLDLEPFTDQFDSPRSATFTPVKVESDCNTVASAATPRASRAAGWNGWEEEDERVRALELLRDQRRAEAEVNRIERELLESKRRRREAARAHGHDEEDAIAIEPE